MTAAGAAVAPHTAVTVQKHKGAQQVSSNFASPQQVQVAMLAKLAGSALTAKQAKQLQLQAVTATTVAAKYAALPAHRAGFVIPYFDLQGKPTKFYRFRYLEYDNARGFAALVHSNGNGTEGGFKALKHDLRYGQPSGSLNELYLPPLINWAQLAAKPETPLLITEGELKAACATHHGLPCVGLGGVWCFKSNKQGMHLLPMFKQFQWEGRRVYICYDSDAVSNNDVLLAENALAHQLMQLGAEPFVVRIPPLQGQSKTGVDDYIVQHGADVFMQQVLQPAGAWRASEELYRLNTEVMYVTDPGVVLRLANLQRLTARAFIEHAYANRIYHQQVGGPNGSVKVVERSAPREWLKWAHRATVERITYAPGQPQFLLGGELNVWPGWGCVPTAGPVQQWQQLLDYLFKGAGEDTRRWFEQWLAYPLQHPGTKLYSTVLLWGTTQGTGKSLVGYTMFKLYGRNATEISDRQLQSSFNEWAENKQFVMGDEIASSGERKRDVADRMKSMITQRQLRLNPKYVPSYTVPDCINYYFTSNHPDAFFMEDDDRRFFIHEVRERPLAPDWYHHYWQWVEQGGSNAIFQHLLTLDVSDFDPQAKAPSTASKQEMIISGKSDVGVWAHKLRHAPDYVLQVAGQAVPYKLWTTEELFALYDPTGQGRVTVNGLARELRRAGFRMVRDGTQIRTQVKGPLRLWAIRDCEALLAIQQPKLLGDLYDKERGGVVAAKKVKF